MLQLLSGAAVDGDAATSDASPQTIFACQFAIVYECEGFPCLQHWLPYSSPADIKPYSAQRFRQSSGVRLSNIISYGNVRLRASSLLRICKKSIHRKIKDDVNARDAPLVGPGSRKTCRLGNGWCERLQGLIGVDAHPVSCTAHLCSVSTTRHVTLRV